MSYNLTDDELLEIEKGSYDAYNIIKVVVDALNYRNEESSGNLSDCIKLLKTAEQKIKEVCLFF